MTAAKEPATATPPAAPPAVRCFVDDRFPGVLWALNESGAWRMKKGWPAVRSLGTLQEHLEPDSGSREITYTAALAILSDRPEQAARLQEMANPSETPNSSPVADTAAELASLRAENERLQRELANLQRDCEAQCPECQVSIESVSTQDGCLGCEVKRLKTRLREQTLQTQATAQQVHDAVVAKLQSKGVLPDGIDPNGHPTEQVVGVAVSHVLGRIERLQRELANERASGGQLLAEALRERDEARLTIAELRAAYDHAEPVGEGRSFENGKLYHETRHIAVTRLFDDDGKQVRETYEGLPGEPRPRQPAATSDPPAVRCFKAKYSNSLWAYRPDGIGVYFSCGGETCDAFRAISKFDHEQEIPYADALTLLADRPEQRARLLEMNGGQS